MCSAWLNTICSNGVGLLLLGTPSRDDFRLDEDAADRVVNVSSRDDLTQLLGGLDFGGSGAKFGLAGRDRTGENVTEVDVVVIGPDGTREKVKHGDLHTNKAIIDLIWRLLEDEDPPGAE